MTKKLGDDYIELDDELGDGGGGSGTDNQNNSNNRTSQGYRSGQQYRTLRRSLSLGSQRPTRVTATRRSSMPSLGDAYSSSPPGPQFRRFPPRNTYPLTQPDSSRQQPISGPNFPADTRIDIPETGGGIGSGNTNECRICFDAPIVPYFICNCTTGMCAECLSRHIARRELNGQLFRDGIVCEICRTPYSNLQLIRDYFFWGFVRSAQHHFNRLVRTDLPLNRQLLLMTAPLIGSLPLALFSLYHWATGNSDWSRSLVTLGEFLSLTYGIVGLWYLYQCIRYLLGEGSIVGATVDESRAVPRGRRRRRDRDDNDGAGSSSSSSQQV